MGHNFKYALKTLFKNKMLIFWTFAFPIILGTLFYMAFSDIENSEKLDIIDIAIIENEEFQENELLKESFKALSDEKNEERLFEITYTSEEEAKSLLEKGSITGYLLFEDSPKVVVTKSGINETILKYVVEELTESEMIIKNIVEKKMQENLEQAPLGGLQISNNNDDAWYEIHSEVQHLLNETHANIYDTSSDHLSYTMIEFYTLIAMACLYGGILGMVATNQNLANMSHTGKRIAVSPTPKRKLIFSSILASYITQLIGVSLLFLYTIFVLKVDYGNHLFYTILLAFLGSLAGLSLGVMIASLLKANDNTKTGIIISITMLGCFLSGMMGITMKYIVDKNIPILNKLNPASMITDGFYALYYYDTFDRYYFNVISLLIFSIIMISISIFCLRRQKYDSI